MTQEQRLEALTHAIAHRRSAGINRLKSDPIDKALLERSLEAANWAPSNGDTEPWRFVIFTGEGRKKLGEAFAQAYKDSAMAEGNYRPETEEAQRERAMSAPAWIAIGMEPGLLPDGTPKESEHEELMAVACAVQNMHLVLSAQGLIGMWHSKGTSVHPSVAKTLGWDPPARLLGFFWCGWPQIDWPEGERGDLTGRVRWVEQ